MLSKSSVPALPSVAGPGPAIHDLEWEPGVAAGGPAFYAGPYCTDYAEEVKASAPEYDSETRISTLLGASLHDVYIIDDDSVGGPPRLRGLEWRPTFEG